MSPRSPVGAHDRPLYLALLPLVGTVFVAFLIVGLATPVLPFHVRDRLGLGTVAVGLVSGAQFAASLLSRFWSGSYADSRGPKQAVVFGLVLAALSGVLYGTSWPFMVQPGLSVALLLLGRALLGAAESFIITGALSWALTIAGPEHTGKVVAWVGTSMYVAFAVGAPLGTSLYASNGFAAVTIATAVIPLLALASVVRLSSVSPLAKKSPSFTSVLKAVWIPGVGLAFSSVGFGVMTTFVSLLFVDRGWGAAWMAFSTFSLAFIIARLAFGHLPDRLGGAKVALVCVLIEALGQLLIWKATGLPLALAGAALTGFGYSLVYPGLGVEAVQRTASDARGLAMGAYTAFLDLTLGVATPALGLLASIAGLPSVFLASALVVACSAFVALFLTLPACAGRGDTASGARA